MIKNVLVLLRIVDVNIIKKFFLLNLIFLFNSLMQLIYIYSIFPLVSSVTGYSSDLLLKLYSYKDKFYVSFLSDLEFSVIIFILFSVIANLTIMLSNYMNFNFTYSTTVTVRTFFFKKISNKSYLKLISKNSSYYVTIILTQVERFCGNTLGSLSNILNQVFLILLISIPLLVTNFNLSVSLIGFLIVMFLTIIIFMKKLFFNYGKKISFYLENRNNLFLQLIKNFREIKIFCLQNEYVKNFSHNESKLNQLYKLTSFISHSTKPILEILLIFVIAVSAFLFIDINNLDLVFFSKLSVLLFSFYKLAPAFNNVYSSFNTLSFDKDAVSKLIIFLKESEKTKKQNLELESINSIKLQDINFAYETVDLKVLKNINLEIKKNNIYLLSGKSGSGKSTLLNILIGLINADDGNLFVNDKKIPIYENEYWFKKVAYVSQDINLLNDTLLRNVALGEENIDKEKVKKCLDVVGLLDDLKLRLNDNINENNSNLSGGQLQRIGIARAIYKNSELLIFDEPTSNLDPLSEKIVTKMINNLKKDKIVLIVSHKLITNIDFAKHFKMSEGKITEV
jgi:ATP-binding cassette, subfamily B, bacterial PglK